MTDVTTATSAFGIVDAFGVAGLVALIKKVVDLLRQLRGGDRNGFATQIVVWVIAVALFWLAAASSVFANVDIGGVLFSDLDWPAKILGGLALGSAASVVTDSQKAKDNTDTAALPALFPTETIPKP